MMAKATKSVLNRRALFGFGLAALAAPAIVRVSSLMPVAPLEPIYPAYLPISIEWLEHLIDPPLVSAEWLREHFRAPGSLWLMPAEVVDVSKIYRPPSPWPS